MCKFLCCKRLVDFLTRHSCAYMQVNQKPCNQGGGADSAMEQCMQVDSSVMTHQHVIEASFTNGLAALCGWVTCLCHRIRSAVKRAIELGTLWSLVHLSLFRSNCAGSPDPLASQSWPFRIWPEEDQLPNMDVSEEGLQPSYPS